MRGEYGWGAHSHADDSHFSATLLNSNEIRGCIYSVAGSKRRMIYCIEFHVRTRMNRHR
jgi:hypothetical protein